MKLNKLFTKISVLITSIALLLVNYACTDGFEKLNTDPALLSADQIDVNLLLTRVQQQVIIQGKGTSPVVNFSNYAGYSSSNGNHPFNSGFFPNEFDKSYKNLLNLSEVIRLTEGKPDLANKHAIARIMRTYVFQYLTDLYSDVPYSEATQSADEVITQPKYDTQESIYKDMLNELKEAASELDENLEAKYGSADLIYNGNIGQWRRFANSLRLRLALRTRYADESLASTQIGELLNADLMEDNSGSAFVSSSDNIEDNLNPVYVRLIKNGGLISQFMGKTIVDILKEGDDPRLPIMATPTENSVALADANNDPSLLVYRGRPLGLEVGGPETDYYQGSDLSQIGIIYRQPVVDRPVMYYSEVCFAFAESKLALGLGATDADTWFKRGIRSNMQRYGIIETDIDVFMTNPTATLSGSFEEQLEQIINQKNVALFPNALEAWSEWRRTGYPKILIGSMTGETNGEIPRRINYPVTEINFNGENYQEASNRIGGDNLLSKMWWDTNPNVPYEHSGVIGD